VKKSIDRNHLRELIQQELSANKINKVLKDTYGAGIRKQELLSIIREEKRKPKKPDVEKYIPKKYKKELKEYILLTIMKHANVIDKVDFARVYQQAARKTKENLKNLIEIEIIMFRVRKRYFSLKFETGTKEEMENAKQIDEDSEDFYHAIVLPLTQQKNILAYLYAASSSLVDIELENNVKNLELMIGKKLL